MANQDTDRSDGMPGTTSEGSGRNPREYGAGVSVAAMSWDDFRSETMRLMDAAVERENMIKALHRVERNKGAAGTVSVPVAVHTRPCFGHGSMCPAAGGGSWIWIWRSFSTT